MTKHDKHSDHAEHTGHSHDIAQSTDASLDDHDHKHDHAEGDCCAAPSIPPLLKAPDELTGAKLTAQGMQTPIRIMQMDCPTEEGLLRSKLGGMPGVTGIEFNLMQRVLTVTHEPQALDAILDAVRSLGFTPEVARGNETMDDHAPEPAKPWWPLVLTRWTRSQRISCAIKRVYCRCFTPAKTIRHCCAVSLSKTKQANESFF